MVKEQLPWQVLVLQQAQLQEHFPGHHFLVQLLLVQNHLWVALPLGLLVIPVLETANAHLGMVILHLGMVILHLGTVIPMLRTAILRRGLEFPRSEVTLPALGMEFPQPGVAVPAVGMVFPEVGTLLELLPLMVQDLVQVLQLLLLGLAPALLLLQMMGLEQSPRTAQRRGSLVRRFQVGEVKLAAGQGWGVAVGGRLVAVVGGCQAGLRGFQVGGLVETTADLGLAVGVLMGVRVRVRLVVGVKVGARLVVEVREGARLVVGVRVGARLVVEVRVGARLVVGVVQGVVEGMERVEVGEGEGEGLVGKTLSLLKAHIGR